MIGWKHTTRAAAAALVVLASAGSQVRALASTPNLPGNLTIEASSPVRLDFTLTTTISILSDSGGESPALEIQGQGRAIGAVILPLEASPSTDALRLLSVQQCGRSGCGGSRVEYVAGYLDADKTTEQQRVHTLPAGGYSLHVVTDGSPVTIRLTSPDLTGSATWRPTTPTQLSWVDYEPNDLGPYAATHGTTVIGGTRGVLFNYLAFGSSPHVVARWAPCYYDSAAPGLVLPGCLGGEQGTVAGSDYVGPPAEAYINWYGSRTVGPATWTQAWWIADPIRDPLISFGFWLDPYSS